MKKKIIIGVDLGGTNVKFALISGNRILKRTSIPTANFNSRKTLTSAISENIISLYKKNGFKKEDVIGIGIGVPGLVDARKGIVKFLTNIKGWRRVPLKRIVEKRTGIRTFVDNDVNVITLGEYYFGISRKSKNFISLTLGTGVGGGIIIDGKLYRGSTGSAGEIGHISLNERGPRCNCGGIACLEAYVGSGYLVKGVIKKIKEGRNTVLTKIVSGDLAKITPEIISLGAAKKDKLAKDALQDAGEKIGIALSGVINFLDVDTIIIGGGVSKSGKILFDSIRRTVKKRAMAVQGGNTRILPTHLKEDAGFLGAAVLVKLNKKNFK